jgi:spermidine synthase/MFS family permease
MNRFTRWVLLFLFFFSGFSSLVYQVVWTRMAFASFGIITPVLSVVLSVFMLGLAIGSWGGGRFAGALVKRTGLSAAFFYAGAELLIGCGAFAVPHLFNASERLLLPVGQMDSATYLLFSALALAISIFPWCVCMGATFPFMMGYVRELDRGNTKSFSFLYSANVLGAMTGTFYTAVVLVEKLGFRHTLWVAAAANFTIGFISLCLAWEQRLPPKSVVAEAGEPAGAQGARANGMTQLILFSTGFVAMAMEVVWSRAFTPVLKTQVYSFALIVFAYLVATFAGAWKYRVDLRKQRVKSKAAIFSALALTAFLPVLVNDPRFVFGLYWSSSFEPGSAVGLLASICPFCGLLGYLTPSLIDEVAAGEPRRAGRAYAINVLGCILGPLVGCYLLLPFISERIGLILLGLPFIAFWLVFSRTQPMVQRLSVGVAAGVVVVWAVFVSQSYETFMMRTSHGGVARRDYVASVLSLEFDTRKALLVNGVGMTKLTPITKFMSHLPLAFHDGKPQSVLCICFGMGTTYRSALSWDIDTTAVELVPSVPKAFGFYHADAASLLKNPKGTIIIDDGRRYLNRCGKKFDVIVVDPPPPIEAAGSSLLFSRDFYELAKQHLNTNGILQMWFPGGELRITQAVARSIFESFPYVRGFSSIEGWGVHFLASSQPIPFLSPKRLAARMPIAAQKDLLEWDQSADISAYVAGVVTNEYNIPLSLNSDASIQVTDDQPYNEYFLLRRMHQ